MSARSFCTRVVVLVAVMIEMGCGGVMKRLMREKKRKEAIGKEAFFYACPTIDVCVSLSSV